jgi:arylesterase/paraoxonase
MKVLKIILALLVIILILGAGGFIVDRFYTAGEFKTIKNHFKGQCDPVEGVFSSEDITIDQATGRAYISSADRRTIMRGQKGRQGAIYGFDMTAGRAKLVKLTAGFEKELQPHGIGLLTEEGEARSLFVVNHPQGGNTIEIFNIKGGKLVHRETIAGSLMTHPNDVLPVGAREFYVSNDHASTSKISWFFETYIPLARSFVLYYDGKEFKKVAEGLAFANGVAMSRDGTTAYVAATQGKKIVVYDRNAATGGLTPRRALDLDTGPDNIEVDSDGNLWIGAHPKLITLGRYASDPTEMSPAQALKVSFGPGNAFTVDEVYLDEGKVLSGSSVAAPYKDRFLLGSIFDELFLNCKMFK